MTQFKPGDTVRLKSGGPLMTVTVVEGSRTWVTWFDKDQKLQSGIFDAASLEADDDTVHIA